ncbi:Aromatic peroxygenase [Globisporangium polare]
MVSFTQTALATVLALAALTSKQVEAQGSVSPPVLAKGDFYRPSGAEVSGFPGTTATYRRSPCPALNALANHGYLPRDGKDITRAMFKEGIMSIYNIGEGVADFLVSQVPETLSLDYLGTHNFIEHDASLVHADTYLGTDPSLVDPTLLADVLGRANSQGRIGVTEIAAVRKARGQSCKEVNPNCDLGVKPQFLMFAESSLLLLGLGGDQDQSISKVWAESFLSQEKIPADYKKPATDVSFVELLALSAKIKALSVF